MAGKTFTAQLKDFADKTSADMRNVARQSIQDVVVAAQTPQRGVTKGGTMVEGKIPVAESDLINSLVSGLNGAFGAADENSYVTVIAGMELGDTARFAWTVAHALPMEMGYTTSTGKTVPGRHFVGLNAARFPDFVTKNAAKVRSK